MNQSSPYPCDNNTITIEIYSNVPFFAACSPMVPPKPASLDRNPKPET